MRRRPRLPLPTVAALLGLVALVLAGCSGSPLLPGGPAASGGAALVTVEYRGGECPAGPCGSIVEITGAGTVTRDGGLTVAVPQQALTALVDAIRSTDFPAVLAKPFVGECPVNYDGQEAVYTIATPTDGQVVIASCEVLVDPSAPLFVAIQRIVDLAPFAAP